MTVDSILPRRADAAAQSADGLPLETVRQLAAQFESLLLAQMLRDMQVGGAPSDAGMDFSAPLRDTVLGELAGSLTKSGGFGLAKALEEAMVRSTPGLGQAAPAGPELAEILPANVPLPAVMPVAATGTLPTEAAAPALAINPARISSAYGMRQDPLSGDSRMHHGIDIPLSHGDDVRSVGAGRVIESREVNGYGQTVVVDHGDGLTTRYAHLSARNVAVGDQVGADTVLGLAGRTGRATGTHLHLEVRSNGVSVDPLGIKQFAAVADDIHKQERKP